MVPFSRAGHEFEALLNNSPQHLAPVIIMAYYTGMRRAEILYLTWDNVDLDRGFIRLYGSMTKTKDGRVIPLNPRVQQVLKDLPKGLHTDRVFLRNGRPFNDVKRAFKTACRISGIEGFTFNDFRHCALNNLRLAGNDYFKIMSISGHKTTSVFK
ncbi:site-specific integrase [Thermodesulfobacteriota bacterium]